MIAELAPIVELAIHSNPGTRQYHQIIRFKLI